VEESSGKEKLKNNGEEEKMTRRQQRKVDF
jgi:hypothetical protein